MGNLQKTNGNLQNIKRNLQNIKEILQNTSKYTYEQFIEELHGERTINSGLTKGLSSGLISQSTWELSPVYYFDVSR